MWMSEAMRVGGEGETETLVELCVREMWCSSLFKYPLLYKFVAYVDS